VQSLTGHILDRFLYKENVQEICDELGLPVSGNKDDLVLRVLGDARFSAGMALNYVDKEGLKALCEELGFRPSGTRADLESRILNFVQRLPLVASNEAGYPSQY